MPPNVFKISAKLKDLFPPDDPNSSWLLRLAILRDDFEYEAEPKGVRPGDPTQVWLSVYMWRKLAITIGEVKNIFSSDVAKHIKEREAELPGDVVDGLRAGIRAIEEADSVFGPIRDGLGAHVRPINAIQTKPRADPTPDVLRRFAEEEFEVVLDMNTGRETSFCGITATPFIFAWPGVATQGEYMKLRTKMHEVYVACFNPIRHGIDLVMALQWQKAGLLK